MSSRLPATQPARLAAGGLIDRSEVRRFEFDGRSYTGCAGDTLASALLANGVQLVGRSFKYHRPRGILTAGSEEPNALVELRDGARREANTRATCIELFDGLRANSQNRWPSLRLDVQALNGWFAPLLGAGFYYKTFMWPAAFWERLYEPLIRRAAGLGRAATQADPDHYEKAFLHCDLLVIGAGPTGLMAALTAARAGARVVLADEDFRCGGRCLAERHGIADTPAAEWAAKVADELRTLPDVKLMTRTTVYGAYDGGVYGAVERVNDHVAVPPEFEPRQRLWRIHARQTILAAGAIERPLVFGNNDLPGVMLAGAVRSYQNRFAVRMANRCVVFTDNDSGWSTAADLTAAGVAVVAVVDPRDASQLETLASHHSLPASVARIRGTVIEARGRLGVNAVEVRSASGHVRRIECDLLAVSGGWTPTLHLASHLGHRPRWDERRSILVADSLPPHLQIAGAANGDFTLAQALQGGARTGAAAAERLGLRAHMPSLPETTAERCDWQPVWQVSGSRGKCFVDYQNDVTTADLELAHREGYSAVEHLKRYTTLGMATDQGKTANVTALALLAGQRNSVPSAIGTTTYRPPYTPVALGAFAGHHRGADFRPTRLPPSHRWAQEQGAVFIEAGPWLRAQYFPRAGESDWLQAVTREVNTTRSAVGICDVSTLGKIDLQGPDAAALLDRVYSNTMGSLAIGRARYGLMLREDGFMMDDGTVARLGDQRFLITTTTANAVAVYQHLHYCHQVLWPRMDVQFVSVTDQWAQYSVAGPHARTLLERVVDPAHDLSNAAFPYMAAGAITLRSGVRGRLFRISFSGELAYEIAVPARHGDALIRELFAAGAELGVVAYGLESLGVMRVEKGHVAGGELNGQTTAYDLGLGRMVAARKDCIGGTLSRRAALLDPQRPRLVGIRPLDRGARLYSGAHFIPRDAARNAANDHGHVSSVAYSPTLGHWIGLGLLRNGPERVGEQIAACDPLRGIETLVEVCSPVFVDPQGVRLHG